MTTKAMRRCALMMSGLIALLTTVVALGLTALRLSLPGPGTPGGAIQETAPAPQPMPALRSARIAADLTDQRGCIDALHFLCGWEGQKIAIGAFPHTEREMQV